MNPPAEAPTPPNPLRSSARTRVAVVGAGYIADFHFQILAGTEDVELVAVCDVDLDRAKRSAAAHGAVHAVSTIAELADLGVHVAHVLVPPDLHFAVARDLLEHGVGVFVEKPLALTSDDARALCDLAQTKGLPLGVNHNAPYHPGFARLLADLSAGKIGRLEHVQVTLSVPLRQLDAGDYSHWMFRRPRNIVFEQAPHPFARLVELIGAVKDMDVSLLGTRELNPGQVFHDRWLLAARGERGTAEVYLAFGQDFTRDTIQVLGTDGSIQVDLHHHHYERERKTQWLDFWNTFLAGWRRGGLLRRSARRGAYYWFRQTLGLGAREDAFYAGMRDSIRAFHRALRAGETPHVDGIHGLRVIEWCEAATARLVEAEPAPPVEDAPGPARNGETVVLGGTGFIGRRTIARLLARNVPVTAVVRRRHTLPPVVIDGVREGKIRLFVADLENEEGLRAAIAGARTVLHLATGGGDTWDAVQRTMVQGSAALARLCLAEGVERLLYTSSTAALYLGPDCGAASLGDEVGPDPEAFRRAVYARGKAETENALLELHAKTGLRITIVRPAIVVGKGTPLQHSGLGLWVRDNHCVGWGPGTQPVPLVDVEDVADALERLVLFDGDELDGRALNLAARTGLTAREVVDRMRKETKRDFVFHPRSLLFSQMMEIGKWIVKKVGGRRDAAFPQYRDLKSRAMHPELTCNLARDVLGWRPCDDGDELLRRMLGAEDDG